MSLVFENNIVMLNLAPNKEDGRLKIIISALRYQRKKDFPTVSSEGKFSTTKFYTILQTEESPSVSNNILKQIAASEVWIHLTVYF